MYQYQHEFSNKTLKNTWALTSARNRNLGVHLVKWMYLGVIFKLCNWFSCLQSDLCRRMLLKLNRFSFFEAFSKEQAFRKTWYRLMNMIKVNTLMGISRSKKYSKMKNHNYISYSKTKFHKKLEFSIQISTSISLELLWL